MPHTISSFLNTALSHFLVTSLGKDQLCFSFSLRHLSSWPRTSCGTLLTHSSPLHLPQQPGRCLTSLPRINFWDINICGSTVRLGQDRLRSVRAVVQFGNRTIEMVCILLWYRVGVNTFFML